MIFKNNAAAILAKMKEIYDQHIIIETRFGAIKDGFIYLKDETQQALAEFRRLIERNSDKLEEQERIRARSEAEMLAKIAALQARLDALSEKAMRLAVTELAEKYLRSQHERPVLISSDGSDRVDEKE